MQGDLNPEQQREYLERLLSHPESAELLLQALSNADPAVIAKAINQQEEPKPKDEAKSEETPAPIAEPSDTAITLVRHLVTSGAVLGAVACFALAWTTPLKSTFDTCFNLNTRPNTGACLGAKRYVLDADHVKGLTRHLGLHVVPKDTGKPMQALALALAGTICAVGAGVVNKQALREASEAVPINRTNRRTGWTANKIEADKVIKERYQALQYGFAVQATADNHAAASHDTANEFLQMQAVIDSMKPGQKELFFQHLAIKEQQAQIEAQVNQQDSLTALLGVPAQQPQETGKTPTPDLTKLGETMINNLVTADRSIIFLGVPGSGKSVSMRVLIGRQRSHYGSKLKLYAIGSKGGDTFAGIRTVSYAGNLLNAWDTLKGIYEEHRYRQDQLSANQRKTIGKEQPICLVFDDYKNFCDRMKSKEGSILVDFPGADSQVEMRDAFNNSMSDIAFNGREGGVKLVVGTQASNVADLPFLGSSQARESVVLCFQARQDPLNKANGFGVIDGVLKNANLIGDAVTRHALSNHYPAVKKASIASSQPVILSSVTQDGIWALALVPDLTKEDEGYEAQYLAATKQSTVQLSESAQKIYQYLEERKTCSSDALKKWCNRNEMPEVVRSPAIQELISQELIDVDEKGDYVFINSN